MTIKLHTLFFDCVHRQLAWREEECWIRGQKNLVIDTDIFENTIPFPIAHSNDGGCVECSSHRSLCACVCQGPGADRVYHYGHFCLMSNKHLAKVTLGFSIKQNSAPA